MPRGVDGGEMAGAATPGGESYASGEEKSDGEKGSDVGGATPSGHR